MRARSDRSIVFAFAIDASAAARDASRSATCPSTRFADSASGSLGASFDLRAQEAVVSVRAAQAASQAQGRGRERMGDPYRCGWKIERFFCVGRFFSERASVLSLAFETATMRLAGW